MNSIAKKNRALMVFVINVKKGLLSKVPVFFQRGLRTVKLRGFACRWHVLFIYSVNVTLVVVVS